MATVYSDYYTTGTYTKTRVRVDYSGTSATAYLLYTRTNSYWTQAGDPATFTFGGQSVSFALFGNQGPATDIEVCHVSFTISSSGGTYSGSTGGNPGFFAFSGSVFIPSQATAPSNGSIGTLSTYWDQNAYEVCIKTTVVTVNDGGAALTTFNLLAAGTPYTDSGYPDLARIAVNCINGAGNVISNSRNQAQSTYTMQPNALVYTGLYAQNSVGAYRYKTADGAPTIITAPASFEILPPTLTSTTAEFHVYTSDDGGYYDKTLQYRLNGGSWVNWTVVQDMFSDDIVLDITGLTPNTWYTLECQVVTPAGTTACNTLHFATPPDKNLYGSVSNAATHVNKFYGSVNSQTAQVYKIYGSVNGEAKPIFIRHVHE
jgi:hypothetical protein